MLLGGLKIESLSKDLHQNASGSRVEKSDYEVLAKVHRLIFEDVTPRSSGSLQRILGHDHFQYR